MKPFVTDQRTKRQCWKNHPMINRGKAGKIRSIRKWRSHKSARRFAKVHETLH